MKILYAGLRYGFKYFDGKYDASFAHINIYLPLVSLPNIEVEYFFLERIDEIGRRGASSEMKELVDKFKPELLFIGGFNHDLDKDIFHQIKKNIQASLLYHCKYFS